MTNVEPVFPANHLPEPPLRRRRRWLSVTLALVIFAAGLVCGAGLTVIVVVNRLQNAIHNPEVAATQIASAIDRRLGLNDEQRQKVEAIVARRQQNLAAIRREVQPQVEAELNELRQEVAAVLDDSQREAWSQLFDRFRARWLPKLPPPANEESNESKPSSTEEPPMPNE
jgi:hypothetical protein